MTELNPCRRGRALLIAITMVAAFLLVVKFQTLVLLFGQSLKPIHWAQLVVTVWLVLSLWRGKLWARVASAAYWTLTLTIAGGATVYYWPSASLAVRGAYVTIVALSGVVAAVLWFSPALRRYLDLRGAGAIDSVWGQPAGASPQPAKPQNEVGSRVDTSPPVRMDAPSPTSRLRVGYVLLFVCCTLLVTGELLTLGMKNRWAKLDITDAVRIAITLGLIWCSWRGMRWARWWIATITAAGALIALALGVLKREWFIGFLGFVSLAITVCLFTPPVRDFLVHQRACRRRARSRPARTAGPDQDLAPDSVVDASAAQLFPPARSPGRVLLRGTLLTLWAALVVAISGLVILGILYPEWLAEPESEGVGFREYVQNPDVARQMREAREAERLRKASLTPPKDEAEIRRLVEDLFAEETYGDARDRLALAGDRAVPALLAALKDSRIGKVSYGGEVPQSSPLGAVLSLLEPFRPPKAVPLAAALLDHPDEYFRQTAGAALASWGLPECAPPVRKALNDSDDYVRGYTQYGIEEAIREGRASPEFLAAVWDSLVALLETPSLSMANPAELLLSINRARAAPLLLSGRYLRLENSELNNLLEALRAARVDVPAGRLLDLLAQAEADGLKDYTNASIYAEGMLILAGMGHEQAEPMARRWLDSPHERVRDDAAEALCVLNGIPDPAGAMWDRLEKVGLDGLTEPQRTLYVIRVLVDEVRNGGYAQYFVNSSGDLAGEAAAALRRVGVTHTAAIHERAVALFGRAGPSPNRDKRHRQLAALSDAQDAQMNRLDSEFYEDKDRIEVRLSLYAIEHKDHFRR